MNTWTEDVDLTARERAVLACVVELYIGSGAPVSSRQIVASSGLDLSSATIRNVVAVLESKGLLTRPHASAGSLPTDHGYRTFVDSLSCSATRNRFRRYPRPESLIAQRAGRGSRVGRPGRGRPDPEAGVAMRPIGEEPVVEGRCRWCAARRAPVLGVIVNRWSCRQAGAVFDDEPRAENLQEEATTSPPPGAAPSGSGAGSRQPTNRMWPRRGRPGGGHRQAAVCGAGRGRQVQFAGTDRLLRSAEFTEAERIRSLLSALHDRRKMAREWRRALDKGPTQVIIGRESEITASGNLGMVATLFFKGGRRAGAVGVVGPRRMNYGRIVPVVKFIGDALTRMLEEPGASHA
jgi:heat-inducible transcriptional repressor